MSSHLNLPQLTDENITVPKQIGHWEDVGKKVLISISEGIVIDDNAVLRGVSSIPDIWARPLMFQSILRGPKNKLRKKLFDEWKGLITLLALSKHQGYDVEILPVELPDENEFARALKKLAPSPILFEKGTSYKWTDVLLVLYKGIPIGGFSPSTLVFTGADYGEVDTIQNDTSGRFEKEIDSSNCKLCPPKSENDKRFMGEWITVFQEKFNAIVSANPENQQVINFINGILTEWLKELKKDLGYNENESIDAKGVKVGDENIRLKKNVSFFEKYKIYKELLCPLVRDDGDSDSKTYSDISLVARRHPSFLSPQGIKQTIREVVIITHSLLEGGGRIWEYKMLNNLGGDANIAINTFFKNASGTEIDKIDLRNKNAMWIRPELYFLSNILLKNKDGNLLNEQCSEFNYGAKYIPPFKKEILDFYSPLEIKELLKPSFTEEDGAVKFSFFLPIINKKVIKIEKIFRTKKINDTDGVIQSISPPVAEIFPNYLGENWRRYYLFQSDAEKYQVSPYFFDGEEFDHSYKVKPEIAEREHSEVSNTIRSKVKIFEFAGDFAFPDGLEFKDANGDTTGIVLLYKTFSNPGLSGKWKIGIDFGTSNTNIYKNRDKAELAEKWLFDFESNILNITASSFEQRENLLYKYFIPAKNINLPITTTLKIYNFAKKERMLLDYFIFYPQIYSFPEIVHSDLKWDAEGERKTEYFIESLLFLLLVDIVKNNVREVELSCSYPKAFADLNLAVFKGEWERVYSKLLKSDKQNNSFLIPLPDSETNVQRPEIKEINYGIEGVAAGEYFANEKTIEKIEDRANKSLAAVCLDVGGGTTDISIWFEDNIEFDASVLLAGRQIARMLQKNRKVREILLSPNAVKTLLEKEKEPASFASGLNLILKHEEENIKEMLNKHANQKDVIWLRQRLSLEFAGLAYYTTMILASANNKLSGSLAERLKNSGVKLHWGGNAAKFINWIDLGHYDKNGIASKILNPVFYQAIVKQLNLKPYNVSQLQSPEHKSEASGGLVVMPESSFNLYSSQNTSIHEEWAYDENNEHSKLSGIICGEDLELKNGKLLNATDAISNKNLFDGKSTLFKRTSFNHFDRFLEIFNYFGEKCGLFTAGTKITVSENEKTLIRDNVESCFVKMQSQNEDQRLIEPVFIMEIKYLLDLIN